MPLRHTLLGLLLDGPLHGYRLRQRARHFSWIYPMTNTSIYPALHGLEQDGFVSHRSEIHNGRARKVYEVTDAGRRELGRWLAEPAPEDATFRDQLLLKVAMLGDPEMDAGAREWLRAALDRLRQQLAATEPPASESHYARCAREYGLAVLEARARFLEKVLAGAAGLPADAEEPDHSVAASHGR